MYLTKVFQNYVKESLEFLKLSMKDMRKKIDDALEYGNMGCVCLCSTNIGHENMFTLPLDSFESVESLEQMLKDALYQQKLLG